MKVLMNGIILVQNPRQNPAWLVRVLVLRNRSGASSETDESVALDVLLGAQHSLTKNGNCQSQTVRASGSMSMCAYYSYRF